MSSLPPHIPDYLSSVDPQQWPGVATVPGGMLNAAKARRAEAEFAVVCEKADIRLVGDEPDLRILREELFKRIAKSGWLGLAEGYMAGEWESGQLVEVLAKLLEAGYCPRTSRTHIRELAGQYSGLELPQDLIQLFSGNGMSYHGPIFSSGVPTTQRNQYKSYVPGAGKGREPASHFVDVTELEEPTLVERVDFSDAQLRAAAQLLESARVSAGTHVADFPSSGPLVPIIAAHNAAVADVYTADVDHANWLQEVFQDAKVNLDIHINVTDGVFPELRRLSRMYDAITSVEKLETMPLETQRHYVSALDRMLVPYGFVSMQTVVKTLNYTEASERALDVLRAYVWPGLTISSPEDLHRLFDANSNLRIVAQKCFGKHYNHGLQMQRELFEGNMREAAADGFDVTFRRLWVFQLALREALFRLEMIDAVQLTITTRQRR